LWILVESAAMQKHETAGRQSLPVSRGTETRIGFDIRAAIQKVVSTGAMLVRRWRRFSAGDLSEVKEEQLELVGALSSVGLWHWDAETDSVWASKNACTILGLGEDVPLAREALLARIHPADAASGLQGIQASANTNDTIEMQLRVMGRADEIRWITIRARSNRAANGKVRRVAGCLLDDSQYKRAEAQLLQQRQQLTHLTRVAMLGELSGGLAHELHQPLTSILCNAQAAKHLLARVPMQLSQLREILDDIITDDKRAGQIIQSLRALLMRGDAHAQPVEAGDLIRDVVNIARSTLIECHVQLVTRIDEGVPVLQGVRVELEQVLLNLILNACEAMSTNAQKDRQMDVTAMRDPDHDAVRISVLDRGPGIEADKLGRVFDPFFSTKHSGLGLGLSICHSIIVAHKGKLWAENRAGQGAAFHFTVPIAAQEELHEHADSIRCG
jgi:C4-dicarboxylate-specific signal transduction histidine kinase